MAANLLILTVALALLWLAVVGDLGCFVSAYNSCVSNPKGGTAPRGDATSGPAHLTPG